MVFHHCDAVIVKRRKGGARREEGCEACGLLVRELQSLLNSTETDLKRLLVQPCGLLRHTSVFPYNLAAWSV